MNYRKEANQSKMKIVVGSIATENIGEMEDNTREIRSRRVGKEVASCCIVAAVFDPLKLHQLLLFQIFHDLFHG